jgi:CMP-N-acetylneuraminic acid synthetase
MPAITVYITNYNYGRFLKEAIESVLSQSCQDFELLIIDDGSTDDSLSIIELYRNHPKVRVLLQMNKGLNATNNVAIQHANGKYIIRLDADDYFDRAALGVMLSIMEADEELGLVFPDYHFVDVQGERIGSHRRHIFDDEVTLYDQPAHGACTMVRLSMLKALNGYNEAFTCQDGYELWIKFITFHKVTNISRPLFYYRQHQESLSSNQTRLLETRKQIKAHFVEQYLTPASALLIIPIRLRKYEQDTWPLAFFKESSVLQTKIEQCMQTRCAQHVVLVSDNLELVAQLTETYKHNAKVIVMSRPEEYASTRARIHLTIDLILANYPHAVDAIGIVSTDYPYVDASVIDEAVDTLQIFKSDSVVTVSAGKGIYFRHNGQTLKPIFDLDQYTVYEREVIYSGAGGVLISTMASYRRNKRVTADRVAHVLLDQRQLFSVNSAFHYELFKKMQQ